MKTLLSLFIISAAFIANAQSPTVGLIFNNDMAQDGYILFAPEKNTDVFLLDKCGLIVNQWSMNDQPGNVAYLLENGNLLQAGKDNLEIRDWDNNLIWEYATTSNGIKQHHDIEPLPNGNILCIVTDNKTTTEMINAGRDPNLIGNNFKMDKILEIEPVGSSDANIVWEWWFYDHLIQDFDNTKANFGVVNDHPELLNANYDHGNLNDWTHVNGIDYNDSLDQIIISARGMSELYIIDHSTTTQEAASHAGGNSGKGGDFLWRWGNPIVYGQGTAIDQKLFGQHNPVWVKDGYLHDGKISVFNNAYNGSSTNSAVHLVVPSLNGYNYNMTSSLFEPADFFSTWSGDIMGDPMYSNIKAGVDALPNGGFLICETTKGRFTEVDESGNVVWVYKNPSDQSVYNQFDIIATGDNHSFRAEHYPPNYPGIVGNDVTPTTTIENANAISDTCSGNASLSIIDNLNIQFINPVMDRTIALSNSDEHISNVEMYSISGKLVQQWTLPNSTFRIAQRIESGIYLLRFEHNGKQFQERLIIEL